MKKILLSSVALIGLTAGAMAADLPSRRVAPAPVIPVVPAFTWTGFYVGVQAGYVWAEADRALRDTVLGVAIVGGGGGDLDGFVGGAHAGFNYQFGSLVVGVEADLEGIGADDDATIVNALQVGDRLTVSSDVDFQGSLRARFGFAFDRALIYATGGLAFVNFNADFAYTDPFGVVTTGSFGDDTEWGWTLGAGVEYAFTNNFTARVEYRFTQIDSIDGRATIGVLGFTSDVEPEFHTIRLGVSYKF